jgi:signal transduction histidine kinase
MVAVSLQLQALGGRLRDPRSTELVAYRIVQEALANARAHARAGRVAVRLEEVDGGVLARVGDDGVGFLPGLGTTVEAWLPRPRASGRSSRRPGPARCR